MSTAQSEPSKVFQYKTISTKTKKRKPKLTKQQQQTQEELLKESTISPGLKAPFLSAHCSEADSTQTTDGKRRKMATRQSKINKRGIHLTQSQENESMYESASLSSFRQEKLFLNSPHYFSSNPSYPPDSYRNDSYLPSSYHVLYHYHHHHHHHGLEKTLDQGLHRIPYNHRQGKTLTNFVVLYSTLHCKRRKCYSECLYS